MWDWNQNLIPTLVYQLLLHVCNRHKGFRYELENHFLGTFSGLVRAKYGLLNLITYRQITIVKDFRGNNNVSNYFY